MLQRDLVVLRILFEPTEAPTVVPLRSTEAMDVLGGLTRWYSIKHSRLPEPQHGARRVHHRRLEFSGLMGLVFSFGGGYGNAFQEVASG